MSQLKTLKVVPVSGGKVGVAYQHVLDFPDAVSVELSGLEESGLQYDPGTRTISGTPATAGDYAIECKLVAGDGEVQSVELKFSIFPDPRSLWKDLPVPEDIPFPKADTDSFYTLTPSGRAMAAASRRGRSHAHGALPRDDDFLLSAPEKPEGWHIMAVADGAGSAIYSREGSRIACRTAVEICRAELETLPDFQRELVAEWKSSTENPDAGMQGDATSKLLEIFGNAARTAYDRIKAEADKMGGDVTVKHFATTLLLTLACPVEDGWFISSLQIGDGAVAVYSRGYKGSWVYLMGSPDEGEFAGQTRFLTMSSIVSNPAEIANRVRIICVPDFSAIVQMTDGVSDPWLETDARMEKPEVWDELWQDILKEIPKLENREEDVSSDLLEWLLFWSVGNHDDRTIAMLY